MGKRWAPILRLIGIGWYIAFCIILGVGAGLWLDRRLHTNVLFTLLGLGLGLIVAFWGVYRLLRSVTEGEQNKNKGIS